MRRLALVVAVVGVGLLCYPGEFGEEGPAPWRWRVLALVVEETELQTLPRGAPLPSSAVRFTAEEKALIRKKHAEFEEWLNETTGGRVRAETDVLELRGPLTSLTVAGGDPERDRPEELAFWAGPADVAPLVRGRFPADRYQMVLAWVKLPAGVRTGGGAFTSPVKLRGSPFSSHFWFEDRAYTQEMGFEGISHEFYHQITFWLTGELGYDPALFPSNHPPNTVRVDGGELLPAGAARRRWYTHVLSDVVTEDMWAAMLAWQDEASAWNAANLAYDARPIGGATAGEVRDLDRLNDGSVGHGGLRDAAASHPPSRRPVEAWFGVEWDRATEISRVTAYPGLRASDTTYLAVSLVLEYDEGGRWREVPGTDHSANERSKIDFAFATLTTRRVRLRIFDERPDPRGAFYRAACLELEVYR